jgi:branched-chain amino acid transport system substrate-binding protein
MLKKIFFCSFILLTLLGCNNSQTNKPQIKVGAIMELTGSTPAVGASSKNAAELAVNEVNEQGGLTIDGQKMPVKLLIEDNAGKADQAASAAQKLISQDEVLAIVGPNASTGAIPASEVAEGGKTVLITPWSTDPKTTLNNRDNKSKQYVFRACFIDPFEAKVLAHFAYNTLHYKTAAVLYDVASQAPNSQASTFKEAFEKQGGKTVAYETYTTHDKDFSAQLTKIKAANPDVLLLPAYYNDVPLIAQQAKRLGLKAALLGTDAWSSPELIPLANGAVEGAYFANHYSPEAKVVSTQNFVSKYQKLYGKVPDDIAALTYDSLQILFKSIQKTGKLDRQAVRDNIAQLSAFEGVTGTIKFTTNSGDPVKSAVIMQVKNSQFVWVTNASS